jgi:hypothetical protein
MPLAAGKKFISRASTVVMLSVKAGYRYQLLFGVLGNLVSDTELRRRCLRMDKMSFSRFILNVYFCF